MALKGKMMPGPVSDPMGSLIDRMRSYAKTHPTVHEEFTKLADDLERVCDVCAPSIPKLVGMWAKARRRWCEETGEDLV